VTRQRLRPAHGEAELARLYAVPHDHTKWLDHEARVAVTLAVARTMTAPVRRAADLSCGDGAILRGIRAGTRVFGDLAPAYEVCGPLEETLTGLDPVDLYVCCETLEHLDDPDSVLKQIRAVTSLLVLSTPVDAWQDPNVEHYWAWDRAGVEGMLRQAGFTPAVYTALDLRPVGGVGSYCFGIWLCR